jgi:hypothetical protein
VSNFDQQGLVRNSMMLDHHPILAAIGEAERWKLRPNNGMQHAIYSFRSAIQPRRNWNFGVL